MKLVRIAFCLLVTCAPLSATHTCTHCYIAASGCSDSNTGAIQGSPWCNAPGMSGATGNASTQVAVAGDQYTFRGCDTWTLTAQWTWPGGAGSSGNPIIIGARDTTWYNTSVCPSAWNRPIITGAGSFPGAAGSGTDFFRHASNFLDIQWIEWTGMFGSNGSVTDTYLNSAGATNEIYENNYFHGMTHQASVFPVQVMIWCNNTSSTIIRFNYFDNGDGAVDGNQLYGGAGCSQAYQNYFANNDTCVEISPISFHDNTLVNCGLNPEAGSGDHNNIYESNTDVANAMWYNNLVIHGNTGNAANSAQLQWAPQSGNTTYIFNNVIADSNPGANHNMMCVDPTSPPLSGTCVIFNNTCEGGADTTGTGGGAGSPPSNACGVVGNNATLKATLINNHFITSAAAPAYTLSGSSTLSPAPSNEVVQSQSAANTAGYTLSGTYAFAPTSVSGSTVGAGVNETSVLCSTINALDSTAGAACLSDTTYGVSINSSTHQVIGLARTTVARPSAGSWDVGAYQFSSGTPALVPAFFADAPAPVPAVPFIAEMRPPY